MSGGKLRKVRLRWCLLYFIVMLAMIIALITSILYMKSGMLKTIFCIYFATNITMGIIIPIEAVK